jgi:hypothetical protein
MGKVIVKRDKPHQCFARLELNNGDQVMISIAQAEVKVIKMKWAGMLPGPTLWKSGSVAEIVEKFFDETKLPQRPIEAVIDKVIDCRSAAEVVARLSAKPDDVLSQYTATLEETGNRVVIRDLSELPYPKDLIKSALRHYLKKVNRVDQKAVEALEAAYVSLSHFQPLTPEERDAAFLMQSLDASDVEIEGADLYSAVISRWHAEGAELLDELRSISNQAEPDNGAPPPWLGM